MTKNFHDEDYDLSLKLFIVLLRSSRSVADYIEEDIKNYHLNKTEFAVLELLYHKGEQPIQQIGKKVLLSSGSITYVVDKLEKKELIVRRLSEKDRRVTYAVITEKGKHFMAEIFPKNRETIHQLLSPLSDEQKKMMIDTLKIIGYRADQLQQK
ncbi:MarR family winged helix-turn-helix transcriptional regulator [Alkalihalobacillus trypoxylicola]|uniref:Transcriptional regulator n=1 Tax=Alkalihalobacillus trypoxylicola TaxID=519424 RepID=A0A162DE57_9BACI|nr:MarR family transcriptional regulator [Alkalihalobacillus trypoxylicola]KYG29344.1 transcriptional regulator [Alkalihalobacillus trypoxylicola]